MSQLLLQSVLWKPYSIHDNFPRVNFKGNMLKGTPLESSGGANSTGWSNEFIFFNHDSHVNIPDIEF